jgi:hypothetical protein
MAEDRYSAIGGRHLGLGNTENDGPAMDALRFVCCPIIIQPQRLIGSYESPVKLKFQMQLQHPRHLQPSTPLRLASLSLG